MTGRLLSDRAEQKRLTYALEAERGTTTHRTFEDKINAYWRFLKQNRHLNAYDVK